MLSHPTHLLLMNSMILHSFIIIEFYSINSLSMTIKSVPHSIYNLSTLIHSILNYLIDELISIKIVSYPLTSLSIDLISIPSSICNLSTPIHSILIDSIAELISISIEHSHLSSLSDSIIILLYVIYPMQYPRYPLMCGLFLCSIQLN